MIKQGFEGGTFVEEQLPRPDGAETARGSESVTLVQRQAHRVTVRVKLARAGLVVFSDTWTPDWKATVDGRVERVVPANMFMRAVPCPAGEHTISVYYESESFRRGSVVSLVSLVVWLVLMLLEPLSRRFGPLSGTENHDAANAWIAEIGLGVVVAMMVVGVGAIGCRDERADRSLASGSTVKSGLAAGVHRTSPPRAAVEGGQG
ncbi:MAG: hypothetical protein CM1200mP2_45770 [Planctomycetaceae bacterium]|nr:MAG: hypothetical protein CM1200mP2_45770 [Planctomycetaceae bacterium]